MVAASSLGLFPNDWEKNLSARGCVVIKLGSAEE
jgi:hypothetical protein